MELTESAKQTRSEYMKTRKAQMSPEALEAARQYQREWRKNNREKVNGYSITYWEKRASQSK